MTPQFDPDLGGYGGPKGRICYQSKSRPHIPIRPLYTHYMPILHRLDTMHNAADRGRTDRAIGIGENVTEWGFVLRRIFISLAFK